MTIKVEHVNREGERIAIHKMDKGIFKGQYILNVYDDPPPKGSGVRAPMLLDYGTQQWLKKQLQIIDADQTEGSN